MDDFSYNSDIAPLQRNYFSDVSATRGLSERESSMLTSQYAAKANANLDAQIKIAGSMMEAQRDELIFREQQFKLKQAADAAKLERDNLTKVPEVTQQLTSVLNDPSLDDTSKTIKIAELKFKNADLITYSKTANNLFAAADERIESRKADRDRVNALINPLVQTGQSETLKKILEGKNIPMAEDYVTAAEAIRVSKIEEAKRAGESELQKEQRKAATARETTQQSAQVGLLNNYLTTLNKLAPEEPEVGGEIGTLTGKPSTTAIPQAQPFKFEKEDRIKLEEMMRDLNPMLENEDLSKYSDDNLYRSAVRSTTSSLKKLSGFDSSFPADRFLTTPPPK